MIFQRLVRAIKKALGWSDETKLIAANLDGDDGENFGRSVASDADGSVIVVGCQLDDTSAVQTGSVYVYSGTDNNTITKLIGSDITASDYFGTSVAVSEDGSIIVVGAENGNGNATSSGAVYVYSGTSWATETKLEASDGAGHDGFGASVATSSDGLTIVVGSYQNDDTFASTGSVYVYNGATWGTETKLNASDAAASDEFGYTVDISDDASIIVVGSVASESAYVLTGASWATEQILTASDGILGDGFGRSVAISGDGTVIAVGSPSDDDTFSNSGSVYIFSGASYVTETKLNASDVTSGDNYFGDSVSLSDDGTIVVVGAWNYDPSATNSGAAYVYSGASWATETKLEASDGAASDYFGIRVDISDDGTTVVVGSYQDTNENGYKAGAAYIYSGTSWVDEKKLIARFNTAGDKYGYAVAISGDGTVAVVGARGHNIGADNYGAVYVYSGANFDTETKILASDGSANETFGYSVDINQDGTIIVVGDYTNDNSNGSDAGAIYVLTGSLWATEQKILASDGSTNKQFGGAVSINQSGDIIATGSINEVSFNGAVYVYSGTSYGTETKLTASDGAANDKFGFSVSISSSGNEIVVGAYDDDDGFSGSGSAYVYSGTIWGTETKLTASDNIESDLRFGKAVAISGDGVTVAVGAYLYDNANGIDAGSVYVYNGTSWGTETKIISSGTAYDYFGGSISANNDGSFICVGATGVTVDTFFDSGEAYIFSGSNWSTETKISASDKENQDYFGGSVSISDDGAALIVGATGVIDNGTESGAAYIYEDI